MKVKKKSNKYEKQKLSDLVSRSFEFRAESSNDGTGHITGVPIVFEQPTDIGGWYSETIARGAVTDDVLRDVAFFYNHNLNTKPLARTRTGKLKFTIDDDGVHMDSSVNLKRTDVNDLFIAIEDGDIDGMSFMFRVESEEWTGLDTDYPHRRITKIGYVQEVSAVNYPAYEGTSINARTGESLDSDKKALDNARAKLLDSNDKKCSDSDELELEKLKAKYLYKI